MGMPAADIPYVLGKLAAIEAAICNQPCDHSKCDTVYAANHCTRPLKLVRELEKELGDIYYVKETVTTLPKEYIVTDDGTKIKELLQLIIEKDEEIERLELAFKIVDPYTRTVK